MTDDPPSVRALAPRFEAHGARVVRSWRWTAIPLAASLSGLALLASGNILGIALHMAAIIGAVAWLQRTPRRATPEWIRVDADGVHAGATCLAKLDAIVGFSVVPWYRTKERPLRLVSLVRRADAPITLSRSLRSLAPIELVLDDDVHVAELRAAIGLALARASSQTFRVHARLGCLETFVALAVSLVSAVWVFAQTVDVKAPLLAGFLVPFVLAAVPLSLALLRRVTITLGAEGIHVRSLFRRRFIRYRELTFIGRPVAEMVSLQAGKRTLTVELGSQENARRFVDAIQSHAASREEIGDRVIADTLARGERDVDAWLATVRAHAAPAGEGYRNNQLPEDRLWAVLEDPGADPSARVGAAIALRAQKGVHGRHDSAIEQRVRVAAGTTAFPEVRVALEAIADEPEDEIVLQKVARALR